MRVCFLTHYFPPEVGAPQTRIDLLARTLAERGVEVTVHTCFPHYPSGIIPAPYSNRMVARERRDGISIVRSAVYAAPNSGFARRLADHASFALSALASAPLSGRFDAVVAETPPLFTAASGAVYATGKRAAYLVNVADRWPASAVELGALRNPAALRAAEALERWIYRRADRILTPTEGLVTALDTIPEAHGKCRRVWPVIDIDRFAPSFREPVPRAPLRVLFAGTIGLAQGLEVLVEASRLAGPETVQTTIVGDGADAPRIRAIVAAGRLTNVRLMGSVAAQQVPDIYSQSDVGVVLLRDLPLFRGALPTKLFEAMAAGRALVLAARGESARLVADSGAGIVVEPGDPVALADALVRLHRGPELRLRLGAAGRHYVESNFGAERAAEAWTTQLEEAIAERIPDRPIDAVEASPNPPSR